MRIDGASMSLGDPAAHDKAKLVDAAQRFEGMMLQELLKPMQSSENKWGSDDKDADKSMDTLSSYGTQAVATAISKSGGLGIANSVVKQVTAEHDNRAKKNIRVLKCFRGRPISSCRRR